MTDVTPEMIRAGAEIVAENARDVAGCWASADDVAREVYESMQAARPSSAPLPAWTFPHEWHAEADRIVTGGLRESGPA